MKTEVTETKNEKKEEKSKREVHKKAEEVVTVDSPIREGALILGQYLMKKLKEYRYVILLDIIVFALLFFLIPTVILEVKPVVWFIAFIVFTILPTMCLYSLKKFRDKQIMFSFFLIYLLIFLGLKRWALLDLYGITSHGSLDYTDPWLDAVFVTCIIVFFQYIGILLVDGKNKLMKAKKKKAKKKKVVTA